MKGEAAGDFEDRVDGGAVCQHFEEQTRALDEAALGAGLLVVLQPIGLDHTRRLECLPQQRRDLADLLLRLARALAHPVAERQHGRKRDGIDDEQDERELPVHDQHGDENADDRQHTLGEVVGDAQARVAQGVHVIDEARHEAAGGLRRDARKIAIRQRAELVGLNVHDGALDAGIVEDGHAVEGERADHGRHANDRNQPPERRRHLDLVRPGKGLEPLDDQFQQVAIGGCCNGGERGTQRSGHEPAPVRGKALAGQSHQGARGARRFGRIRRDGVPLSRGRAGGGHAG